MTSELRSPRGRILRSFNLICLLFLVAVAGCSTHAQRVRTAREQFYAGDLTKAAESFRTQSEKNPRDADAIALDLAMVQLLEGQPAEAERTLRQVRDNFDYFEQSDILESGVSLLTDDQRRAYAGESYEKILTRVFLALSNLLNDGQDASYSLQINAKQQELLQQAMDDQVENAELAYTPLAVGPYLRGVIREATFSNYDDASRAYHQVVSWQPTFQAGHMDLQRAQAGVHSRPGHGVVYVFVLVDRGPTKEEAVEVPTTVALLIADRILSAVGEYELPPTVAPLKIPRVVVPPREVDHVRLVVNGQEVGITETICDIAQLARRQEEIELPRTMARAVVRRIVKKGAVYAAKDSIEVDHPVADFALTAAGVAWEATEAADTRCWGLLPREIQVFRLELPIGTHEMQFVPVFGNRPLAAGQQTTVNVTDGRNTYLLACIPSAQSVGPVLQKTP